MTVESFDKMIGHTIVNITGKEGDDEMIFTSEDGSKFEFIHEQSCCELVSINDIVGDLSDLIGSPIIEAEERSLRKVNFTDPWRGDA